MYILAFESSCDDTSVAVLRDGKLISMHTHTQTEHNKTSGVVPEVAARLHADFIFDLVEKALAESSIELVDIDMFAATSEPGLVPSLLVGKTVAQTFAQIHDKPLIWVNHIEAHVFSVFLDRDPQDIKLPAVVLSASGGHNDLFYWDENMHLEKIGGTRDDSAGESMDKVGREMGLPFPAGKYVEQQATKYLAGRKIEDVYEGIFPDVKLAGSLDFSFSGLKSAALREIQKVEKLSEENIGRICFEYQETIMRILIDRLLEAAEKYDTDQLYIVGGVSANTRIKEYLDEKIVGTDISYLTPASLKYCGDNAAMIGITAYLKNEQ